MSAALMQYYQNGFVLDSRTAGQLYVSTAISQQSPQSGASAGIIAPAGKEENRMTHVTRALFVCLSILLLSVFSAATYGQNPVFVSGGPYIYNVMNGGLTLVYD